MLENSVQAKLRSQAVANHARLRRKFDMAKKRGPYKSDVVDPDRVGTAGIRLRQHRLSRGWTIPHLAEVADVSQGQISDIENGRSGFSGDTLLRLAKALKTTVGALFDVDPRPGGAIGELWPIWHGANRENRQRIVDFARGIEQKHK